LIDSDDPNILKTDREAKERIPKYSRDERCRKAGLPVVQIWGSPGE